MMEGLHLDQLYYAIRFPSIYLLIYFSIFILYRGLDERHKFIYKTTLLIPTIGLCAVTWVFYDYEAYNAGPWEFKTLAWDLTVFVLDALGVIFLLLYGALQRVKKKREKGSAPTD